MSNNIKLLSNDELIAFNEKYIFEVNNEFIFVKCNNFSRYTIHRLNESFHLIVNGRKITITPTAINLWNESFKEKYSLFDIQNAINKLIVLLQDVSLKNVQKILEKEI